MSKNTGLPERTDPPKVDAAPTSGEKPPDPPSEGEKPAEKDPNTRTPGGWFHTLKPANETKRDHVQRLMEHDVADAAHGWSVHKHHRPEQPLLITRADYEAAVKGANSGLGVKGIHLPACSPERGKGV